MSCRKQSRRGLTLVEVVVTIALIGMFMTYLSFHLVALSNLWLNRTDGDFFDQHVDGVVLFLNNALEASEASVGETDGEQSESQPVVWARPPGQSEFEDPMLHFRQSEAPALFVREGTPLPAILAYIHFDEDMGLSVLWYSALDAEEIEDERDLRRTPVSRFVAEIEYAYYEMEDDEWDIREDPLEEDDDTFRLPNFLRLTFNHPEEGERIRSIFIPQRSMEFPLF